MKKILLIFLVLLTSSFADYLKDGLGYYRSINYDKAFENFKKSCYMDNSMDGCLNLAFMYERGKGMKIDLDKAIGIYKKTCDKGDLKSCSTIADIYEEIKNPKQSSVYRKKACESGYIKDCLYVGSYHESGNYAKKDYKKALEYYNKGCNADFMCVNRGVHIKIVEPYVKPSTKNPFPMLDRKQDKYIDDNKTAKEYEQECNAGKSVACYNLGIIYQNGKKAKKDIKKASLLYEKSCKEGFLTGCTKYATLFTNQDYLQRNINKAKKLYKQSCDNGEAVACYSIGVTYFDGKKDEQKQALPLMQKGCDLGLEKSCKAYEFFKKKRAKDIEDKKTMQEIKSKNKK